MTYSCSMRRPSAARPKRNRTLLIAVGLLAPTVFASAAPAQEKPKKADGPPSVSTQPTARPTSKSHPNDPMLWDAEQMMDEAVMQIGRRYTLTPQQEEYTRLLLKKRVREFLDQHETEVRELLQESIDMKLGRKENDPKSMMKWAARAMPIYDAAKTAILDGNHEWGVILDEKQKELHEKDLHLMSTNFSNVTTTLRNWEEGKTA
ncbi:MAG TPA: hypothetical protein VNT79_06770, partial [Phycisphaerae bacterium]|nr:hypothetical protein [Phycisphaerae bacterium]